MTMAADCPPPSARRCPGAGSGWMSPSRGPGSGFRSWSTSPASMAAALCWATPRSAGLLMREFERAIERGEDIAVANFVLEQLRKVVRGTEEDDEARPRTDDPARLLYGPLEPFLVESNFPVRAGQIRRASLLPV